MGPSHSSKKHGSPLRWKSRGTDRPGGQASVYRRQLLERREATQLGQWLSRPGRLAVTPRRPPQGPPCAVNDVERQHAEHERVRVVSIALGERLPELPARPDLDDPADAQDGRDRLGTLGTEAPM